MIYTKIKFIQTVGYFKRRFYVFILLTLGCLTIAGAKPPIVIVNQGYRLVINSDKGTIESFSSTLGGGNDELLVPNHAQLPVLKIEFMGADSKFKLVSSSEAHSVNVTKTTQPSGETIVLDFAQLGNLDVNVRVTVRCPKDKPLTYWSMELDNRTNMWVGHIQFPVVEVPFDVNPTEDNCGHILSALYDGVLLGPVKPGMVVLWKY